jgi:hypothetical protein
MNDTNKKSLACIDNMTLEQARRELAWGTFGEPVSSTHSFALQWVLIKEAEERDKREVESLSISRKALENSRLATRIAISAIILSIIMAAYEIIKWYSLK